MQDISLEIGDVVEVATERLAYGGDVVARHNGLAIFIAFAAPGERLRVRIVERRKNFARAVIEEILEPSPARRAAPCQYFGDCGGCQLQHITYEAQLEAKAGFVRDALKRVGKIEWPQKIEVRHAAEFGYRSRAQIKIERFNPQNSSGRRVGFNRIGSHSICDVSSCPVLVPELEANLPTLRSFVTQSKQSERNDFTDVEMVAGENAIAFEPSLAGLPGGDLERRVRGAVYSFSPSTFFQVNSMLLETLIDEALAEYSGAVAIDLYAGVGLFTIQLARRFGNVIGVEAGNQAARFARENISANNLMNVEFYNARVERWLDDFVAPSPDLILLDPPRAGAAEAVARIAELKPLHISYVSCDPTTLARDLRKLLDSGFELERVTAIDLFPQTYHIETVALLKKQ
ncbi:MAG TPA: class I SAM-dependent RNA methyltransferase [Blastocatellia bacterium]|nr:class I SAM-dependent RNA methyltransferase [Blastocatellia bacterium]